MSKNEIPANAFGMFSAISLSDLTPFNIRNDVKGNSNLQSIPMHEIYRIALEKSQRDFELNRLFNPDFYEQGGGI